MESGHETTGLVAGWNLGMRLLDLWQGGVWARDYWTRDRVESGHETTGYVAGWNLGMGLLDL